MPVLPDSIVIPLSIVDSLFPQVTRVVSVGPDETGLGDPKATVSVIYGNSDGSVKVTITVDVYGSSKDASSAFQQALEASDRVPGFQPIRTPRLGQEAFAGSVTMGGETHIGSGVLNGRLIVGVTLAGFDATQQNISKLFAIIGIENAIAKVAEPLLNGSGVFNIDDAGTNSHTLFGGSRGASDTIVSSSQGSGDRLTAASGAGKDPITLGLGNDTVVGKGSATLHGGGNFSFAGGSGGTDRAVVGSGNATLLSGGRKDFFTAGSAATAVSGGRGSENTFVGGAGPGTMDAASAKSPVFLVDTTGHGGTHAIQPVGSAHDKLHLLAYDTTQALAGPRVVGGSMVLNLGDDTTIRLRNFTGLNAKDFG